MALLYYFLLSVSLISMLYSFPPSQRPKVRSATMAFTLHISIKKIHILCRGVKLIVGCDLSRMGCQESILWVYYNFSQSNSWNHVPHSWNFHFMIFVFWTSSKATLHTSGTAMSISKRILFFVAIFRRWVLNILFAKSHKMLNEADICNWSWVVFVGIFCGFLPIKLLIFLCSHWPTLSFRIWFGSRYIQTNNNGLTMMNPVTSEKPF